jgi:hypothetical protein
MSDLRKLLDIVNELSESVDIELHDNFEIELDDILIESGVIGFTEDGIIIEGDETVFELLTQGGALMESVEMDEAKYQGRTVKLNSPMAGDVKKSKVYVKGPKGNVVKVNFGDKNMRIKKNIPGRRKSFRARHNCENPGPKWKARYWSCRAW